MDMRGVPFVDAHVHLWNLSRIDYPWLTPPFADDGPNGSVEPIATNYLPEDYRAESAGWTIAGVVHVEAGAAPRHALDETLWLEEQAERTGLPNAIVAFADLSAADADVVLAHQASNPTVRGIRHIVNWHADPRRSYTGRDMTIDEGWNRGLASLRRHGLSFDLQCYPGQMMAFARLAERYPEVPVAINHMGMPVLTDPDGLGDWRRGLSALAALPQVSIKLSGLGFIRRSWDAALVAPLLREAIDVFGTDRAMAASDFPTDRLFADFDRSVGMLADVVGSFSEDERRAVWGTNAQRFYRIGDGLEER